MCVDEKISEEMLHQQLEETYGDDESAINEEALEKSLILEEPDEDIPLENIEALERTEAYEAKMGTRAKMARKKLLKMVKENPNIKDPFKQIRPILEGKENE